LDGLIIETLYLGQLSDLDLLPAGYEHPCPSEIGTHQCNRALFEVYGNGVYIGDSKINNNNGVGGGTTVNGTFICQDYDNTPAPLTGGVWTGSSLSRYNKMIITQSTALAIAAAGSGGTIINFSLIAAMTTYGVSCGGNPTPHANTTWLRLSLNDGTVIYNGCPDGNFTSVDVCSPATTTTTTSTTTSL